MHIFFHGKRNPLVTGCACALRTDTFPSTLVEPAVALLQSVLMNKKNYGKHTLQSTHQWRDFVLQMLRAQEPVFGAVTIKTSPELEEISSISSISSIQADSNKT